MCTLHASSAWIIAFPLFPLFSISIFLSLLFIFQSYTAMKRHAIDLPTDFTVTFFCLYNFQATALSRVYNPLPNRCRSRSLGGKCMVITREGNLRTIRRGEIEIRGTKEGTNERGRDERDERVFRYPFSRWIAVFIRQPGSNSRREMS